MASRRPKSAAPTDPRRRRAEALSTQNKGFTAASASKIADEHSNMFFSKRAPIRVDNDVKEESPKFTITGDVPNSGGEEDRIKHYQLKMKQYPVDEYPEEWALCHYFLGRIFFADREGVLFNKTSREGRAKSIETALFHFDRAMEVYRFEAYPSMFGIVGLMMSQLYRERISITTIRSLLARRGTIGLTIRKGIDNVSEASAVFSRNDRFMAENVICALETGWLFLLQYEDNGDQAADLAVLEQSISYLERALSLCEKLQKRYENSMGDRTRPFNPQKPEEFPPHITLITGGRPLNTSEGRPGKTFAYIEGLCMSILGKAYSMLSNSKDHQQIAFDYINDCLKPKFLIAESEHFVEAHYLCANIIIKCPAVVNPDWSGYAIAGQGAGSIAHLDSAILHLELASHSPYVGSKLTDIQFLTAQLNILKLHHITDNLQAGQSLTKALADNDGNDIMRIIDSHLHTCLKRITSADMNTQDAYIYFFSNLKLSEMSMLQTASQPGLSKDDKLELLQLAVIYLENALRSRSLNENVDLHYVSMIQMSQMLVATRNYVGALAVFCKIFLCLSVTISRAKFSPAQNSLSVELKKQTGLALSCACRLVPWVIRHSGPLRNQLGGRKPIWSFEEACSQLIANKEDALVVKNAMIVPRPSSTIRTPSVHDKGMVAPTSKLPAPGFSEGASALTIDGDIDNLQPLGCAPSSLLSPYWRFRRRGMPGTDSKQPRRESLNLDLPTPDKRLSAAQAKSKPLTNKPQRISFFGSFFGSSKPKERPPQAQMKKDDKNSSEGGGWFGRKKKRDNVVGAVVSLWGSDLCLFVFMLLSRVSRLNLLMLAEKLNAGNGERAKLSLKNMSSSYERDLNSIYAELFSTCKPLESPIMSLYDLGSRAFRDMKNIFRDQVAAVRLLRDLEMLLLRYMSGEDCFVPMISTIPTLSRSIAQYDDVLLSKTVLEGDRIAAEVEADLIDSLDSFHIGNKDFLAKHLGADECIIVWYFPIVHSQPVMALLVWRELQDDCYPDPQQKSSYRSHKANETYGLPKKQPRIPFVSITGNNDVIVELAKSETDSNKLRQCINQAVHALHSRPANRRLNETQDALKLLSEALSLTELLSMIPPHITALTICCPPIMRLIPWTALCIDSAGPEGNLVESPILERYTIKLGPSLSLIEVNSVSVGNLVHSFGLHKMTCVDGNINTIRETGLEVDCVTDLWSLDPDDYTVLSGEEAIPEMLRTTQFENYKILKIRERELRRAAVSRDARGGGRPGRTEADDETADEDTYKRVSASLRSCRVLHVCAGKVADKDKTPGIVLMSGQEKEKRRVKLDAKDIIEQLYLRNCALCVLSRFGISDDVYDAADGEQSFEFIEALHLAGASTVLYPLWGGQAQGALGVLANNLFLIRFYEELSYLADEAEPITDACRRAQLWLRDSDVDHLVEYVKSRSRISEKSKLALIADIDRYAASYTQAGLYRGGTFLFSHYLYWASYVVSGVGRGVHPPEIGEVSNEKLAPNIEVEGEKVRFNVEEAEYEAEVLRLEGRYEESQAMKKLIMQQRIDKASEVVNKVKNVGSSIMSKIMRGLDSLLDSDSENEAEGKLDAKTAAASHNRSDRHNSRLLDSSKLGVGSGGGGKINRVAIESADRDSSSPNTSPNITSENKRLTFLPVNEEDLIRMKPGPDVKSAQANTGCIMS